MTKAKLFQYSILWHPTEKQEKEDGLKSKMIIEPKIILALDQNSASMTAVMDIPQEYRNQLDQVEVALRPF